MSDKPSSHARLSQPGALRPPPPPPAPTASSWRKSPRQASAPISQNKLHSTSAAAAARPPPIPPLQDSLSKDQKAKIRRQKNIQSANRSRKRKEEEEEILINRVTENDKKLRELRSRLNGLKAQADRMGVRGGGGDSGGGVKGKEGADPFEHLPLLPPAFGETNKPSSTLFAGRGPEDNNLPPSSSARMAAPPPPRRQGSGSGSQQHKNYWDFDTIRDEDFSF